MDIKLNNFNEEHRKLKEKLAFFDDVIEREKQLGDEEKQLAETKISIEILAPEVERVEDEIKELKAVLESLKKEYEMKKAAWEELGIHRVMLTFELDHASTGQNLEQLKAAFERVKQYCLLLEQKLRIEELSAAVASKQADFDKMSADLGGNLESVSILESNISVKETALKAAKLNWARMLIQSAGESQQLNNIKGRITSSLRSATEFKDNIVARKDLEILKAKREAKANADLLEMAKPLIMAGSQIRSRNLEWKKENPNHEVIGHGNASACLSMALADASLYQNSSPNIPGTRTDTESFKSLYGIAPDFVWRFRSCPKFINFVDWCANLKDFQAYPVCDRSFPSTRAQRWAARILTDMAHNPRYFTARGLNEFFEDRNLGLPFYEELKNEHAAAMDKHKYVNNGGATSSRTG